MWHFNKKTMCAYSVLLKMFIRFNPYTLATQTSQNKIKSYRFAVESVLFVHAWM